MSDIDLTWQETAEHTRDALALLGYPVSSPCLPHEAEPCGGGYAEHTGAHLAAIRAVADHQLGHLGWPVELADQVYDRVRAELAHRDEVAAGPADGGR